MRMDQRKIFYLGIVLVLAITAGCSRPTAPAESSHPPSAQTQPTTVPPAQPAGNLNISNLNAVAPGEAVKEMYVFGQGGELGDCPPLPDGPAAPGHARQPATLRFYYCWPGPGAGVEMTAADPRGEIHTAQIPVQEQEGARYIEAYYQIDLSRPTGHYVFTFQGQNLRVELAYEIDPPVLPVFYELFQVHFEAHSATYGPHHRLQLAGFAPNEPLRLWVYRSDSSGLGLMGWQELQVDGEGQLQFEVNLPVESERRLAFGVTGPRSGEVHLTELMALNGEMGDPLASFAMQCPGAPPTRFRGEMQARATRALEMRGQPGLASGVVSTLATGEVVDLGQGPFCVDGSLWWQIFKRDGTGGYLPEGAGMDYFLEPLEP